MEAPMIAQSTREEREQFIKDKFPCIADCDMCGLCAAFHGKTAELVYKEYIDGTKEFMQVSEEIRSRR